MQIMRFQEQDVRHRFIFNTVYELPFGKQMSGSVVVTFWEGGKRVRF